MQDVLSQVVSYYEGQFVEETRLSSSARGQLEWLRTRAIVSRYLAQPPLRVLDVGGAAGPYAFWLASEGHEVTLVDPVRRHVDRANQVSGEGATGRLKACAVGDARSLQEADASADVVLMLGPLYHLVLRADRLQAIREAFRIVRPGGLCFFAGISRFASMLDGYCSDKMTDLDYVAIVTRDLTDGQHRNDTEKAYFTTAYFHEPQELAEEIVEAGFEHVATLPVEGPFWMFPDLQRHLENSELRDRLLGLMSRIEHEPSLLGVSAHLLAVAKRPV